MTEDAFGTSALRRAVAEAWLASPTRFREDANTEEDHARGYYRDRVVVELAQNAADAAAHAGVVGRLALRLARDEGGVWWLTAENSGSPLDAQGVASLASMRASAKVAPSSGPTAELADADGAPARVGRFGVGFAAVRSVADEVQVRSTLGAVVFSLDRTRAALAEAVAVARGTGGAGGVAADRLEAAVGERGHALPVLRLPFAADALPVGPVGPVGPVASEDLAGLAAPDTVVSLRLRDAVAVEAVRAQLDEVDDALLLALPALGEVLLEIEDADGTSRSRRLHDVAARWTVVRARGAIDAEVLDSLPVEQRHEGWSVLWALPRSSASAARTSPSASSGAPATVAQVLHAPTPTDEPLTFPALLVASFPLDPSRRHVLPGPVTDELAARAGEAYARLLALVAADRGAAVLGLLPTGLPAGTLDGQVRDAAFAATRGTPLLSPVLQADAVLAGDAVQSWSEGPGWPALPESASTGGALRDVPGHPLPLDDGPAPAPVQHLVAPRDAQLLSGEVGRDAAVVAVLGRSVPDLVDVPSSLQAVARSLGARSRELADLLDELPGGMGPAAWREVYAVLAPHVGEPGVLDALGAVPVPLVDGRTARGARGVLLLGTEAPAGGEETGAGPGFLALARSLGLRLVHPDAAHPLLERLGATPSSARGLLTEPSVRERVLRLADQAADGDALERADVGLETGDPFEDGPPRGATSAGPAHAQGDVADPVPAAVGHVLGLVRAALAEGALPEDVPFWWGELPLPTADGDLSAARECLVPGSWAAEHLDGLVPLADGVAERWGEDVLRAVGVQADVSVHRVRDVLTPWDGDADLPDDPDDPQSWLDGWAEYLASLGDQVGGGAFVGDLEAVADLDAVADDAWPAFLARLARDPAARAALLAPVRGQGGARSGDAPSYTAWWLRRHLGAPFAAEPGGVPFLPDPPDEILGLDAEVVRALGGVVDLGDLAPGDWPDYLAALPDAGTPLDLSAALAVWQGLGVLARSADGRALDELPDRLPGLRGAAATCVAAEELAVATSAMWAQTRWVVPIVHEVGSRGAVLADLLDLPLLPSPGAPDVPRPDDAGSPQTLDPRVEALVPGAAGRWFEHEALSVAGVEVDWWVCAGSAGPEVHASTTAGLARGLAAAAGRPEARHLLESALLDPAAAEELRAETAWDRA